MAVGVGEALWDLLVAAGKPHGLLPTGLLAMDVARIEAGLILLDVDYVSAKKALIPAQKYSPYEIGLGRLVHLEKAPFIGQAALRREESRGAHYRSDFPEPREEWRRHIVFRNDQSR